MNLKYLFIYVSMYICTIHTIYVYMFICLLDNVSYYYVTSDSHCAQCLRIGSALPAMFANRLRNARSVCE